MTGAPARHAFHVSHGCWKDCSILKTFQEERWKTDEAIKAG
jgi:hypothetical protein